MNFNQTDRETKEKLLDFLLEYITPNKKRKFDEVLLHRTRHITVVLEDLYQPHNASAVLRTCDCTGVHDVHIIENSNEYHVNRDVALGSSKWLNLIKYNESENNTPVAFEKLRSNGYKIVATTPHRDDVDLHDIDIHDKMALVFGTELEGLSNEAMDDADAYLRIPMFGFTESYNISVSAAIVLSTLTHKLRNSQINWQLTKEEIIDIKLGWAARVLKNYEAFEKQFFKLQQKHNGN